MLTEALVTDLIKAGLNRLVVSIDGARPETVARIRIGIDLNQVLDNIRRVVRLKRHSGRPSSDRSRQLRCRVRHVR